MTRVASKAVKTYETWHQKEAKKLQPITYDFPESVFCVGRAVHILYYSDKWEKDGDGYEYSHDFDTKPFVYTVEGQGTRKGVKSLLGVKSLNTQIAMPILAVTKEMTIVTTGGKEKRIQLAGAPFLCCSNNRKTLVIFVDDDPIFINGGKMIVTARGIVN